MAHRFDGLHAVRVAELDGAEMGRLGTNTAPGEEGLRLTAVQGLAFAPSEVVSLNSGTAGRARSAPGGAPARGRRRAPRCWRVACTVRLSRPRGGSRGRAVRRRLGRASLTPADRQADPRDRRDLARPHADRRGRPGAHRVRRRVACRTRRATHLSGRRRTCDPAGTAPDPRPRPSRDAAGREVAQVSGALSRATGLDHRPVAEGGQISGVYRRSVMLASGRFAMLDDGVGFSLVPWKPVLEQRLGQSVSGVMRGGSVSWDLSRQRGIGI